MFDFRVTTSRYSGATIAQLQEDWHDVTTVLFGNDILVSTVSGGDTYIQSMNGDHLGKDGKWAGYEVRP